MATVARLYIILVNAGRRRVFASLIAQHVVDGKATAAAIYIIQQYVEQRV